MLERLIGGASILALVAPLTAGNALLDEDVIAWRIGAVGNTVIDTLPLKGRRRSTAAGTAGPSSDGVFVDEARTPRRGAIR